MNKQELVERLRLTDEEMRDETKKLKIKEPIWDCEKREWIHGEVWQKNTAIAQAQLNKVLNDKDLRLRVERQSTHLPRLTDREYDKLINAGFEPVIPLSEPEEE